MARARFDTRIAVEVLQMDRGCVAECHLRRDFAVSVAHALAMFLEKFGEFRLGYAEM